MTNKLLFFVTLIVSTSAHAYVGPGLGAGTLGVIAGLALSILLALFAIIWYPFKRLLKALKPTKHAPSTARAGSTAVERSASTGD